jgi:hypothetical protein
MLRLVTLASLFVLNNNYLVFAFTPATVQQQRSLTITATTTTTALASDVASDFGSAMPKEVSPYERLGITEDQLALGINPEDVLNYCGT